MPNPGDIPYKDHSAAIGPRKDKEAGHSTPNHAPQPHRGFVVEGPLGHSGRRELFALGLAHNPGQSLTAAKPMAKVMPATSANSFNRLPSARN